MKKAEKKKLNFRDTTTTKTCDRCANSEYRIRAMIVTCSVLGKVKWNNTCDLWERR